MVEHKTLSVELTEKSRDTSELLFLEQEDYDNYTGKLTKSRVILGLKGFILPDTFDLPGNNCGGDGGVFDTVVYAYLYDQGLNYTAGLSVGTLGFRVTQRVYYREVIKFSLDEISDFSYPNESMREAEWVGPVYNNLGEIIGKPAFTFDNRSVFLNQEVYGSLLVEYLVIRHCYAIKVTGLQVNNPDIEKNKYQSTIYAVWNGGIEWLRIDAPPGFEDFDGNCGNGTIVDFPDPDDEPDKPDVDPVDKVIEIDYCTQTEKT